MAARLQTLMRFLRTQILPLPFPTTPFTGQTIIITGSNTGLGLEAARHFARLGASRLILACRSSDRGEAARKSILASLSSPNDIEIEVWQLDLASFDSIKAFCLRAESQLQRLDVVVANAAVAMERYEEAEGYEKTITVNVLGTFLMAIKMLPVMRNSAARWNGRGRLVVVSSRVHTFTPFKERTAPHIFTTYKGLSTPPRDLYGSSKLLEILLMRELAAKISATTPDPPVIVNALNPGFCRTELFRDFVFPLSLALRITSLLIGRSSEMGSRTLVAAAAEELKTHGMYMENCEVAKPGSFVLSEEGGRCQKKVWREVMEILDGVEEGIEKCVG